VSAGSGTDFSLAMLNTIYPEHVLRPTAPPLRGAIVAGLNRAARTLDRRMCGLRGQRPDRIAANYHVVVGRAA
jgi:hypothetical protein